MPLEILVLMLVPPTLFVFGEKFFGPKQGVLAGVLGALGLVVWEVVRFGDVSKITWLEFALFVGLGILSLKKSEDIYFKLQPTIGSLVLGFIVLGLILFSDGFIYSEMMRMNEHFDMPPQFQLVLKAPEFPTLAAYWEIGIVGFLLSYAAWMYYAATKLSNNLWLLSRALLPIAGPLLIGAFITNFLVTLTLK